MKFWNPYYKSVFGVTLFYALVIIGCRFAALPTLIVAGIIGLLAALRQNYGQLCVVYMLVPVLQVVNRNLLQNPGMVFMFCRAAGLLLSMIVIMHGVRSRYKTFPIWGMMLYLLCAVVSSIGGWFPAISFLKIFNFAVMILTLYCISKRMQDSVDDLSVVRSAVMALAIVFIFGSVVTYFIPSIGYSLALAIRQEGYGDILLTGAELVQEEGSILFNGMVYHSQSLAPVVACSMLWVLCDMLFVEMRPSLLHMALLGVAPVLLYMTHSRTGLVTAGAALVFMMVACIPSARLPRHVKRRVKGIFGVLIVVLVGASVYFQARNEMVSRWLRKTDNVAGDNRGLMEAMTDSRQGTVERNMYDFKKNPALGMGFQVIREHPEMYRCGLINIFSAPIEKGVLPLMVIGETGVVGGTVFVIFLFSLFGFCLREHCVATATLFVAFLSLNMGEASFFSPSGAGGYEWLLAAVGGMSVDCLSRRKVSEYYSYMPAS